MKNSLSGHYKELIGNLEFEKTTLKKQLEESYVQVKKYEDELKKTKEELSKLNETIFGSRFNSIFKKEEREDYLKDRHLVDFDFEKFNTEVRKHIYSDLDKLLFDFTDYIKFGEA